MVRIVILQPYVPAYRAPLFTALGDRLRAEGHDLVVAAGRPSGAQAERRDATVLRNVEQIELQTRTIRVGHAQLRLTRTRAAWRGADIVIAELAAGSIPTYSALLQRRRPVGVWGHVDAFVTPDTRVTRWLRRWQARRAGHVLAYTDRGAALAVDWGVGPDRVTALQNSIDTLELARAVAQARDRDPAALRAELGVGDGPVFAMIGGIDSSKRIDLVVGALDELWHRRPDIQLIVGGRGELEHDFDRARDRGQVRMAGYVDDHQKAQLAAISTALLNPGRVGLVAVESMILALPLLTTAGAMHGPEFDYLTPGSDALVCEASGAALAAEMIELADDQRRSEGLSRALAAKSSLYSLDTTVERYLGAVRALIRDIEPTHPRPKL